VSEIKLGDRVIYTGRNKNQRLGTVIGFAHTMVDLKLDDSSREHFYVPKDTIVLIPDELSDTIG
jgi:hypothetical protein